MTSCIRPGEISDDDLIGYVAGETSATDASGQRVRRHVAACPRCAALAADYAAAERRLGRALFRVDCPPALTLGEYQVGLLPAAARQAVAAHLATCPHCTAELATAAGFLDDPAPQPAPDLLQMAGATVRRIIAHLLPAPVQPAAALRGRARAVSRRYAAEEFTLTVQAQATDRPPGHVRLLGFIERQDADLASLSGAQVRLLLADQAVSTTTVDDLGNFLTDPVPPGSYDLEIRVGDLVVTALDVPLANDA